MSATERSDSGSTGSTNTLIATRARRALQLAEVAVNDLVKERPREDRWLVQWAGAVALLRTVGYALHTVDRHADPRLAAAIDAQWEELKRDRSSHPIFWEFVEGTRNNILKQLDLKANVTGIGVRETGRNTAEIWQVYEVEVPGFEGWRHDRLLAEALRWWKHQLDVVEYSAAADRPEDVRG